MPARPCLFVACAPSGSRIHPPYVKLFRKHCPAESTGIVERPKNQGPEQLRFLSRTSAAVNVPFAVGTTIADRPPHRSVRAELPHTAPTLDVLRQIARQDMDAGYGVEESTVRRSVADGPTPVAAADYDGAKPAATACTDDPGIAATPRCYPAQRDSGNNLPRPVSATRPRRSPAHASSGATPASTTAASPSSASPRFDALRHSDLSGSSHSSG